MITGVYLRDHAAHHADRPFFASVNFADPDKYDNLLADGKHPELAALLQSRLLRERMAIAGPWQPRSTFA